MKITMSRIAREAGVSQATVSFVLNGRERKDGSVSAVTQQRVLDVAAQLGYRPNSAARALATGRSDLVGLCVRELNRLFYATIIGHTQEQIENSPYHLLISRWDNKNIESPAAPLLEGIFPWPLAGVLALEAGEILRRHWELHQSWPAPIVSMGGVEYEVEGLDWVGVDLAKGTREALQHLQDVGCRRIAFVSGAKTGKKESREKTYLQFCKQARIKPEIISLELLERNEARERIKAHIAAHGCPDGIFCLNDEMAIAVYRALCDLKVKVGGEVALVGCDNIPETEYLECPLTTIAQPMSEMCKLACETLQQRLENPLMQPFRTVLPSSLIIRQSSFFSK